MSARRRPDAHARLGADGPPLARSSTATRERSNLGRDEWRSESPCRLMKRLPGTVLGLSVALAACGGPTNGGSTDTPAPPPAHDAARGDDGRRAVLVCDQRAGRDGHGDRHRHVGAPDDRDAGQAPARYRREPRRRAGVRGVERIADRRSWRRREDAAAGRQGRGRDRRGRHPDAHAACACSAPDPTRKRWRSAETGPARSSPTKTRRRPAWSISPTAVSPRRSRSARNRKGLRSAPTDGSSGSPPRTPALSTSSTSTRTRSSRPSTSVLARVRLRS